MKVKKCILIGEPAKTNATSGNWKIQRRTTIETGDGTERVFDDFLHTYRRKDAENIISIYKHNGLYQ